MVSEIPGQRLNYYLFIVYRSPSTDNRVCDCICEAMGRQSVDPKSVFLQVISTVTASTASRLLLLYC